MEEKKESFTSLRDILSNLLNDSSLPFNPDDARIWEVWEEAVGPGIAGHARPSRIKKGRLRVDVSDPIWLQELEFVKETIKEKLNEKMGRKAVLRIDFRIGPV